MPQAAQLNVRSIRTADVYVRFTREARIYLGSLALAKRTERSAVRANFPANTSLSKRPDYSTGVEDLLIMPILL